MTQVAVKTLVGYSEEVVFAGDQVRLAGQIDYPLPSPYQNTFPLLFMLHHAGCDDLIMQAAMIVKPILTWRKLP